MNNLNIDDLLTAETNQENELVNDSDSSSQSQKLQAKFNEIENKNQERSTEAKALQHGYNYLDLKGFPISTEAVSLINQDQAVSLKVVCFFYSGNEIRLGALNPDNPQIKNLADELSKDHNSRVELYLISENSFDLAYNLYDKIPKIKEIIDGVKITAQDLEKYQGEFTSFEKLQENLKTTNLSELIIILIASALQSRASDIHVETEEQSIKIRFRIDGVLHTAASLSIKEWPKIISRLKLIAELKINVSNRPQDGRFTISLQNEKIEVRVSTIPTSYGESVVMRILRSSASSLQFEDLGLRGKSFVDLKHEVERPNGMIISTGPTGSGKTTTLYAIVNKLNQPETKIITLEDPVEYKLEGVNQSQIDHSKEYTFAKGLRSILRQDPDVIMVGEIRDLETGDVAINAALTGHLVVSTIHTNSAAGAIPRFLAMGVKPFLLAPALNAVIGQRLVRRICQNCKIEAEINNDTMTKILNILSTIPVKSAERLDETELGNLKFYKGRGCETCHNLGYQGRVGIYEIMTMNAEIEKIILSGQVSEYTIQEIAVNHGMVTMVQDGLLKAKDGITTIDEVFRVAE